MSKFTALYERSASRNPEQIRRQKNNLETYARSNGFENLKHFTDDGYSAFDCNRPGFKALCAAIEADEIDSIIVKDISRIACDYDISCAFREMLAKKGIMLISIFEEISGLPKYFYDDENGINYRLHGDYYFPEMEADTGKEHRSIGKWGRMHQKYLEENHPAFYAGMLLSGKLQEYLADVNKAAVQRINRITDRLRRSEGVTEKLKAADQMEWVRRSNGIRNLAEEVVKKELIFT